MKILLIPTHLIHVRSIPLGIAYIAAVLRQNGHTVAVYDPPPYKKDYLLKCIKDFNPDIIGISCMTPTFNAACAVAERIKSAFSIPVVFGGIHPTSAPEETLRNAYIDYVVIGEGEITLGELVDALGLGSNVSSVKGIGFKTGTGVHITDPRCRIEDLDALPLPARDLFPLNWYFQRFMGIRGKWVKIANMITTRGCPFNCTYCASKVMFGRKVQFSSPQRVVDEIEHLLKTYKLDGITLSDDTFAVHKGRALEICREIKRRRLDMLWRVQMRADTVNEDVVKELAQSGCVQVDMGVESGSPGILKVLKKGITPEQVIQSGRILKKYNMRLCATFMIGNPGETLDDIQKTRELAHSLNADYTQFFITTPYPGTEMYSVIRAASPELIGKISYDNFRHGGDDLMSLVDAAVPRKDIIRIHQQLNTEFLARAAVSLLITNTLFIFDMILLIIQRPMILFRTVAVLLKTGNIIKVLRLWYDEQNYRIF